MLPLTPPDIERIAERIGVPTERWAGNCHGIASAIVETDALRPWGPTDASYRRVRGHYVGAIAPRSYYGYRKNLPFAAHTWIESGDLIIDPTRFAFDGNAPYIYAGLNDGSYDPGGNLWRDLNEPTLLPFDPTAQRFTLDLPLETELFIEALLAAHPNGEDYLRNLGPSPGRSYTYALVMWLANLSLTTLGTTRAVPIFRALVTAGYGAAIPMDNRDIVLGDVHRRMARS